LNSYFSDADDADDADDSGADDNADIKYVYGFRLKQYEIPNVVSITVPVPKIRTGYDKK
jgi:hypothetical protein